MLSRVLVSRVERLCSLFTLSLPELLETQIPVTLLLISQLNNAKHEKL